MFKYSVLPQRRLPSPLHTLVLIREIINIYSSHFAEHMGYSKEYVLKDRGDLTKGPK
jgi:hypothetical protein